MLTAISPIDGRYQNKTKELSPYFSEYALIRERVYVEVEYFIALSEFGLPQLSSVTEEQKMALGKMVEDFTIEDAEAVKEIEQTTNHDVKAVEYWLKDRWAELSMNGTKEFIHFGLTSQDINNTALPHLLHKAIQEVMLPEYKKVLSLLQSKAEEWKAIPMLAHTHGQPASPTLLGKEFQVFVERLTIQLDQLVSTPLTVKFGGATGNFNAHKAAFPDRDWRSFADEFTEKAFGLSRQQTTTQIEHYDQMAAVFHTMVRIDSILIDLCRDVWSYISMHYFTQKVVQNEVGSSAMPHKVNPIDFENAEGNLGIATALFEHLAHKLPISRLQRDLTDSTVLRNQGVPVSHVLIALKSIAKGLDKIEVNSSAINGDLEANWAVVAEAIQNILRREGYPNPYEALKNLTRSGKPINKDLIREFINGLDIKPEVKSELLAITPHNYLGYSPADR